MTTYAPSASTSEGKAPTSSRMTSPPGVSTVKVVLASASAPALLTSLSVIVAQRCLIVTSIRLPEMTLMSALTIELEGVAADGGIDADLPELAAALAPERGPNV